MSATIVTFPRLVRRTPVPGNSPGVCKASIPASAAAVVEALHEIWREYPPAGFDVFARFIFRLLAKSDPEKAAQLVTQYAAANPDFVAKLKRWPRAEPQDHHDD